MISHPNQTREQPGKKHDHGNMHNGPSRAPAYGAQGGCFKLVGSYYLGNPFQVGLATGVTTLLKGVITPFMTGRGPTLLEKEDVQKMCTKTNPSIHQQRQNH